MKFHEFLQSELEASNISDGEELKSLDRVLTEEVITILCHLTNDACILNINKLQIALFLIS